MSKINNITEKYQILLNDYKERFSINQNIRIKFEELIPLFFEIYKKELNGVNSLVENRNEFDLLRGITGMISGEKNKKKAYLFELKYKSLMEHRKKFINTLKKYDYKFEEKELDDELIIKNPDYGYHYPDPR